LKEETARVRFQFNLRFALNARGVWRANANQYTRIVTRKPPLRGIRMPSMLEKTERIRELSMKQTGRKPQPLKV
jgi:hypothetical protein